ncbi:molybdate transport system regulatory protein [Neisseria sp. HSC-16F19]|nr:TOBE domain-containing protein [Neisseria sp. HSC-16F19]MCP2040676.1 molybdate transport system regulatory protein [Neisseria sp. HSC-16F19]
MKTSARNHLSGIVKQVKTGVVNSEVVIGLPGGQELIATVTCDSTAALELAPGKEVIALIKASQVLIAADLDGIRLSTRNQLAGTIRHIDTGAVHSVIELDIGNDDIISASITVKSSEALQLAVGQNATAVFKAGAVILGVKTGA